MLEIVKMTPELSNAVNMASWLYKDIPEVQILVNALTSSMPIEALLYQVKNQINDLEFTVQIIEKFLNDYKGEENDKGRSN